MTRKTEWRHHESQKWFQTRVYYTGCEVQELLEEERKKNNSKQASFTARVWWQIFWGKCWRMEPSTCESSVTRSIEEPYFLPFLWLVTRAQPHREVFEFNFREREEVTELKANLDIRNGKTQGRIRSGLGDPGAKSFATVPHLLWNVVNITTEEHAAAVCCCIFLGHFLQKCVEITTKYSVSEAASPKIAERKENSV